MSPRQKMINMMYLVLIALLALNVSKEVLDAFVLINQGLVKTTANFAAKNEGVYENFTRAAMLNPAKAKAWERKAFEVKARANAIVEYLEDLKIALVIEIEGLNPEDREIAIEKMKTKDGIDNKADTDKPATMMLNEGKGVALRAELAKFREFMVAQVDPDDVSFKDAIQVSLNTDDPQRVDDEPKVSWESEFFEHLPAIAVVCNMSQMQSSIRNAEAEIISYLEKEIDGEAIPFNKVEAIVIPQKTYITLGDTFRADIFLAASDSVTAPMVAIGKVDTVGSGKYAIQQVFDSLRIEDGKGKLLIPGTTTGDFDYEGVVFQKTTHGTKTYAFKSSYTIAEPSVNVSPNKMNVFYIGPQNPVTVSVSGFGSKHTRPSLSGVNGTIKPDPRKSGDYLVTVNSRGICSIAVQAEISPGKWKTMGTKEFRVKKTPPPVAEFMGISSDGKLSPGRIRVGRGLRAEQEDFIFNMKYRVTSFDLSIEISPGVYQTLPSSSGALTQKMMDYLKTVRRGQRIFFENVKAKSENTEEESIPGVIITVN